MDNSEQRIGCFTASSIGRLLTAGTGATRKTYILEVAMQTIGIKDNYTTAAMNHGIANQRDAFDKVIKPSYPNAVWCDKYIPINKDCGASPDVLVPFPIDIKCQFYIDTFVEQCIKIPDKYYCQIQMQALAVNADECGIANYLTRPEVWGDETWSEYPMPLEDRCKVTIFKKDEAKQHEILTAVEKAAPERDLYIECLLNATKMDLVEFFYTQLAHNKYRDIKKCSNIEKAEIVRVVNDFYYKIQ